MQLACWHSCSVLDAICLYLFQVLIGLVRSFSNEDGDGNENVKKAIGLMTKTTTAPALHFLVDFFAVTNNKFPDGTYAYDN